MAPPRTYNARAVRQCSTSNIQKDAPIFLDVHCPDANSPQSRGALVNLMELYHWVQKRRGRAKILASVVVDLRTAEMPVELPVTAIQTLATTQQSR